MFKECCVLRAVLTDLAVLGAALLAELTDLAELKPSGRGRKVFVFLSPELLVPFLCVVLRLP